MQQIKGQSEIHKILPDQIKPTQKQIGKRAVSSIPSFIQQVITWASCVFCTHFVPAQDERGKQVLCMLRFGEERRLGDRLRQYVNNLVC